MEKFKVLYDSPDYIISSFGKIYDLKNKKLVPFYLHKSRSSIYPRVSLKIHGKQTKKFIHILVALNFPELCGERCHGKNQVDHKDGNTLNFSATNLEWVSPRENITRQHNNRRALERASREFYA
jgi:hypothetical protein